MNFRKKMMSAAACCAFLSLMSVCAYADRHHGCPQNFGYRGYYPSRPVYEPYKGGYSPYPSYVHNVQRLSLENKAVRMQARLLNESKAKSEQFFRISQEISRENTPCENIEKVPILRADNKYLLQERSRYFWGAAGRETDPLRQQELLRQAREADAYLNL